jgi:hypothetical protein
MKSIIFLLASVFLITNTYAQTERKTKPDSCYAGIYTSYNDFVHNHLVAKVNTETRGYNFGFEPLGITIKIKTVDTAFTFHPGSIWGYYRCDNTYRYSPDVELLSPEDYYKIEENGEKNGMTIYTSVFYGGNEHFFSTGLNMPIHRLNVSHLEKDFGSLFPEFIEAIKKMKSENGDDIAAIDSNGKFLINKLYRQFVTK